MRRNQKCGLITAVLFACAAKAVAAGNEGATLLAASAVDVQAIVVRDGTGRVHRYSKGDSIAGSGWRLVSVQPDGADFESVLPRSGVRARMRVATGAPIRLRLPPTAELPPIPIGQAQPTSMEKRAR
jgi:hypothetical protein